MARSGDTDETQTQIWGTWEDLLLASAVNRHGTSNWDSVAIEVQSRSPFSHLLTSTTCRLRFLHLRRRFNGHSDDAADLDTSDSGAWVEELRKIRVAELRREVEQYDLSIVSLELKVNRLKEEREHSLKESDPSGEDAKQDPTVEDRKDDDRSPGSTAAEISSRSCKESNSTDLKQEDEQHKPKPEDDSGTGTGTHTGTDRTGDESRESSDVQSSASLSTRRRKDDASSSEVEMETEAKSEPFMAFLEMIRCDKSSGSVFERRLDSQESERYKSMIKRHVDLETIRAKLELRNSNSIESPLEFYRDLLLLCTNALVFFPKSCPEYSAASNLQSLVNKQLASTNLLKPRVSSYTSSHKEAKLVDFPLHRPDPDSSKLNPLLEKPAIIMCRKRSSLSKPSSQTGSSSGAVKEEKQPNTGLISEPDPNPKKTSSTRGPRTNKTRTNTTLLNPNPKAEKQQQVAVDKDKKRNAVDFLNRLKSSSSREKGEGKRGRKSLTPPGKRNVGRPPKRPAGSSSVTPPHSKRFKEDKRRSGGRR